MDRAPFVSIVIASYNRRYIIDECVSAALNQNYPSDRYEVLLVDNNSNDGTGEYVQKKFSEEIKNSKLKFIQLKYNSGSSGSYIEALRFQNNGWEYVLKMDEDLILDRNALFELVDVASKDASITFVGGKVFFYKEKNKLHAVGSKLRPYYAIAKGIGVNELNHSKFDIEQNMEGLNGCMVLISRKIQESIGWFDADYFLYYDDHDLMYKSLKKGFRHVYTPKAIGWHDTGTGNKIKYSNKLWLYYSCRGSLLFLRKNFKFLSLGWITYFTSHMIKFMLANIYIFQRSSAGKIIENLKYIYTGFLHGMLNRTGKYNFENAKENVVIFSGGRGSKSLLNGFRDFDRKSDHSFVISHIINAYDDGLSTGLVRKLFSDDILGPSDLRKIQSDQYEYYYGIDSTLNFLTSRISASNSELKADFLKILNYDKSELIKDIDLLPPKLLNVIKEGISYFNDFAKDTMVDLDDSSISNLIYGAIAHKYNGLEYAEKVFRECLNLREKVYFNSNENKYLCSITESGQLLKNEAEIVSYSGLSPIYKFFFTAKPLEEEQVNMFNNNYTLLEKSSYLDSISSGIPSLNEEIHSIIQNADLIIFSPGTQYSSLYPSYITYGMGQAISKSNAYKILITNIYHDNEIPEFTAADQAKQALYYLKNTNLLKVSNQSLINAIFTNKPIVESSKYIQPNILALEQLQIDDLVIENFEHHSIEGKHDSKLIVEKVIGLYRLLWKKLN